MSDKLLLINFEKRRPTSTNYDVVYPDIAYRSAERSSSWKSFDIKVFNLLLILVVNDRLILDLPFVQELREAVVGECDVAGVCPLKHGLLGASRCGAECFLIGGHR